MTRTTGIDEALQNTSVRVVLNALTRAQKPAARSAPAYSRYVNRRIGRVLAALCIAAGIRPHVVTAISAAFTFSALAVLIAVPPSWLSGIAVGLFLLIGYAFDSADGQVARYTGQSSPAGEWLDHVVDATKASALPLALAVGFFRFEAVPIWWLIVPLVAAVVSAVLFFEMILTEQLRRAHSVVPLAPAGSAGPGLLRSMLVAPMDYGVLCLSFLLLGALPVFLVIYTGIVLATTLFLVLASGKWFRELSTIGAAS